MEKIIISDLDSFKETHEKIGQGSFKECYRYDKNNVVVIYKNSYRQSSYGNIDEQNIDELSKLKTKYFHFANGKFYYNDKLCALKIKYINGYKLEQLKEAISLQKLYYDYENVITEIRFLSQKRIVTHDIAKRNIIYNKNGFNFIDTDDYTINDNFSENRIFNEAKYCFDDSLLKHLINFRDDTIMELIINNKKLHELYLNYKNRNDINLIVFLETLKEQIEKYYINKSETIECFKYKN